MCLRRRGAKTAQLYAEKRRTAARDDVRQTNTDHKPQTKTDRKQQHSTSAGPVVRRCSRRPGVTAAAAVAAAVAAAAVVLLLLLMPLLWLLSCF